jgi:poly(A) polymerase
MKAMKKCFHDITKSSQARLLEELFKMLESGKSDPFFRLLTEHGFTKLLLPCLHHFFSEDTKEIASSYLRTVDELHSFSTGKKLDRTVTLSALIFPILEEELHRLTSDRQEYPPNREIAHLAEALIHAISTSSFVHFPKKLLGSTFLTIVNQFRMTPYNGTPRFHARFGSLEDFSNAMSFLRLRATINSQLCQLCDQWETIYQKARANHHGDAPLSHKDY